MKKIYTVIIAVIISIANSLGQGWTQRANLSGTGRYSPVGFSIGAKGYIGTGYGNSNNMLNDFWEYDPSTNAWTQKANFGGTARREAVGFAIGTKGYIGTGYDFSYRNDFWEYDPSTNLWAQKANFGGVARNKAVGFSIGSKGYIGTGWDNSTSTSLRDFWEYDPSTDTWTQRTNFAGTARYQAIGFSIGAKGYLGTGWDGSYAQDFYEFDPSANSWTPKANLIPGRYCSVGFSIGTKGYVGTGATNIFCSREFWQWDQTTNTWTQLSNYGVYKTCYATGFSIGTKGYIGCGQDETGVYVTSFWEYDPNLSTGKYEIENTFDLSIFPNPSNGSFIVSSNINKGEIEIFDISGIKIYNIEISKQKTEIDLSKIESGIYFMKITTAEGSVTKKIVKE